MDISKLKYNELRTRFKAEYVAWRRIRTKCKNPNNVKWHIYGGRGISVCPQWSDFKTFLNDVGPKPSPKHQIDRINNNGNYEPTNCRWATPKENGRNTRRNHYLTHQGQTKTISEWAEITGLPQRTIQERTTYGWPVDKILTAPKDCPRHDLIYLTINGITKPMFEWAKEHNVNLDVVRGRIKRLGWSPEKALTTPTRKLNRST